VIDIVNSDDSQRHIDLDGQANFRDLGGYQTTDGRSVKWGQVYRSGRLSQLTDEDLQQLEGLGLKTVVNLLTDDDLDSYGKDKLPHGAKLLHLPIDSERTTELANQATSALKSGDFSQIPPELNAEIHRILIQDGRRQYASLMREIANPTNRPLVFHCSHGVHRTGTGAAILLAVLGVSWETIRADYLLSNTYRQEEVNKRLAQLQQMAAEKRGIEPAQVDMGNMEAFLVQHGSYIDASYDEIVKIYGGISDFTRDGLGLSEGDVERLHNELLE
jgi:protein-tyrosine phosphatase